jgi:hypothetical protein
MAIRRPSRNISVDLHIGQRLTDLIFVSLTGFSDNNALSAGLLYLGLGGFGEV